MERNEDKILTCADCGDLFTFEAGEQEFFKSRSLAEPKRCPACRRYRRVIQAHSLDERLAKGGEHDG